jgi:hypothetical protein
MLSSKKCDLAVNALRILAVSIGALQGYAHRFTVYDDDAISYLDIAQAYLRGDWVNALNGYWSPLYSWLLAATLAIFRPVPNWEFALLKVVNFATFLFLIIGFEYFLKTIVNLHETRWRSGAFANSYTPSSSTIKLTLYAAFISFNLSLGGVYQDTPDLILSAFMLFASAFLIKISTGEDKPVNLAMMSTLLAMAYFSKAVALPISLSYFLVAAISAPSLKVAIKRAAFSLGVFFLIAGPYIAVLSYHLGHLTFSETGKIAYCEAVSRSVPFLHPLLGKELAPGCHHLIHPSRVIFDEPRVFEFAEPVKGSFPIWYDPSYWYAGCEVKFTPLSQFVSMFASAYIYVKLFFGPLILAWLTMIAWSRQKGLSFRLLWQNKIVMIPATVALLLYLVGVNLNQVYPYAFRYLPAFFLQMLAGLLLSLRLKDTPRSKHAVIAALLVANILFFVPLGEQIISDWHLLLSNPVNVHWQVARDLEKLGIKHGDRVADLDPLRQYYWAYLAKVKIVAEILDADSFFKNYPDRAQSVFAVLKKYGVKAVVMVPGKPLPIAARNSGWQRIGECDCYVYLIK